MGRAGAGADAGTKPLAPGAFEPMEAKLVEALPSGEAWQFEPKWDGFRCLAFRDGDDVDLRARSGKPLGRYFPEVVDGLKALPARRFVVDGELLVPVGDTLSFDALQARLHPAESRVAKLSRETPADLMLFDMLWDGCRVLVGRTLDERRASLEAFHAATAAAFLRLSPYTRDRDTAVRWLDVVGDALDGVVAKKVDGRYRPGERAMLKVKRQRTADCVVGGFRYATRGRSVGSLLLGLYNDDGLLDHVGFTSAISDAERGELTKRLEAIAGPPGFTGKAPGGPSRWSTDRSADWQPVRPELVVEVRYDQVTGGRFRHGAGLIRWRPDKAPRQCTIEQLAPPARLSALESLGALDDRRQR